VKKIPFPASVTETRSSKWSLEVQKKFVACILQKIAMTFKLSRLLTKVS